MFHIYLRNSSHNWSIYQICNENTIDHKMGMIYLNVLAKKSDTVCVPIIVERIFIWSNIYIRNILQGSFYIRKEIKEI